MHGDAKSKAVVAFASVLAGRDQRSPGLSNDEASKSASLESMGGRNRNSRSKVSALVPVSFPSFSFSNCSWGGAEIPQCVASLHISLL